MDTYVHCMDDRKRSEMDKMSDLYDMAFEMPVEDASYPMAFQVSEELFQQIKDYLARFAQVYHRKLSQKEFVISLIEQALAEADEEFEAAEAAAAEDLADGVEDMDQEDEVTSDVESDEDAEPDDAPEGDAEADAALADCAGADARYDDPAFDADAERAV